MYDKCYDIINSCKDYNILIVPFISSSETNFVQTDSHISSTSYSAYLSEFEILGNSVIYTGTEDLQENPYPSRLRPLQSYADLISAHNEVMFVGAQFEAINTLKEGSTEQVAGVYSSILASQANTLGSYIATSSLNTIPVTWRPNGFRPKVKINGQELLNLSKSAYGNGSNKGDLGLGIKLPFEVYTFKKYDQQINSIEVNAACGQFVNVSTTVYWQRFPVSAMLYFLYR
ncbi:MAG: hypothetical protein NT007_09585 [Candidatus Kapabacteria bacterium]|nr:hypothetical protein [Candidatus Kapabacteria bacterium]